MDKSSLDTTTQSKVFVKSLNGLKWNYIGTFIKMFTQYVVVILLMRLVGPQAYGTMAIALSIIALGNLLNDSGLGAFIVQNPQLTKDDIKSCFTIQMFMSLIVALSVFLGSNLVSNYFNNNELALVLKLLSISFILQAYGVISFNLLKKEFKFKNIQIANISSYIISYAVIGLILAFNNWGVLSLVYAQISQAFLNSLMLYFFTRHSLKLKFVFTKKYL
ncbi:oligosaccharide flippase family protein, partial [Priestia megaterium]|uniref:oligosaccharide flippase family protein n=1 Tax=Priestia megaterium TaxID=1404 RepID=UPI003672061D